MILHKRGSNKDNLLVMEFKTWWNNNRKRDELKLKDFLNKENQYKYKYGAFILINKGKAKINYFGESNE